MLPETSLPCQDAGQDPTVEVPTSLTSLELVISGTFLRLSLSHWGPWTKDITRRQELISKISQAQDKIGALSNSKQVMYILAEYSSFCPSLEYAASSIIASTPGPMDLAPDIQLLGSQEWSSPSEALLRSMLLLTVWKCRRQEGLQGISWGFCGGWGVGSRQTSWSSRYRMSTMCYHRQQWWVQNKEAAQQPVRAEICTFSSFSYFLFLLLLSCSFFVLFCSSFSSSSFSSSILPPLTLCLPLLLFLLLMLLLWNLLTASQCHWIRTWTHYVV